MVGNGTAFPATELSKSRAAAHRRARDRAEAPAQSSAPAPILYGGAARLRREKRNIARPTLGRRLETAKKFLASNGFALPGVARQASFSRNTEAPKYTA
jgi:hypothetical protein